MILCILLDTTKLNLDDKVHCNNKHVKIQTEDIILLLIDQIMIIIGYVQGRIVFFKKKG
jgi:hypothetical protein